MSKRLYITAAGRFIVTAIDGSKQRQAVHDPAFCLQSSGWKFDQQQQLPIPGGHAVTVQAGRAIAAGTSPGGLAMVMTAGPALGVIGCR